MTAHEDNGTCPRGMLTQGLVIVDRNKTVDRLPLRVYNIVV